MNNQDRIAAVQKLGYSERQAEFLCLAALHGGYFLRRQCNTFFAPESSGAAGRLLTKAIERGHVRAHPSANKTLIYHVSSEAFFEIIGEKGNRNRRWRQPNSVKIKLMGLDYLLAHPGRQYLASEGEKIDYFVGQLGLAREFLPARVYPSPMGRIATTRYFVDKFPLFLSPAPDASSPVVGFCYIDGNIGKPSGFDAYVVQSRDLWSRLPNVEVVYVSSDRRMIAKASGMFPRLYGAPVPRTKPLDQDERLRLLEHFRRRELLERRKTASLSTRALDQLREELEEFAAVEYAKLYTRWKVEGDQSILSAEGKRGPQSHCSFSTFELWHDYTLFGGPVRAA